jgi:hypothetical protein
VAAGNRDNDCRRDAQRRHHGLSKWDEHRSPGLLIGLAFCGQRLNTAGHRVCGGINPPLTQYVPYRSRILVSARTSAARGYMLTDLLAFRRRELARDVVQQFYIGYMLHNSCP